MTNAGVVTHKNVVIFDEVTGIPSIMVKFERPKYKNEQDKDKVPSMFIIEGKAVDAIYISKYPNVVIDGRPYSLPLQDPTTGVTFDEALEICRGKGEGWHLMTAVEWEYILDEARANHTTPHGNTDWGKNYYDKEETGNRNGCGFGRTLTGSGPVAWNHDKTVYGVSDMCGNVWEWLAGLRLMEGNIECIPVNNAALNYCNLSKDSEEWKAVQVNDKAVRYEVKDGEITITAAERQDEPDYDGVAWEDLQVDLSEIPQALKDLGLVKKDNLEDYKAYVWIDTEGERLPLRGSAFYDTSNSGPSVLNLNHPRSNSNDGIGFRSAFYEVNGKLVTE